MASASSRKPARCSASSVRTAPARRRRMRIVLDIIHADAGSVTWAGQPAADAPRSTWGYLPEERGLYPRMKVLDQLVFVAALHGVAAPRGGPAGSPLAGRFRIADHADRRAEQLSKGNQQKVQFIGAILHDPDVLLMDEPFSGLDPINAVAAQGGVPGAARPGQGDRLQHPPDGRGRGAVRRDRDHRSRSAGPVRPGSERQAAGRPGRRPPRRRRRRGSGLARGAAERDGASRRASTITRSQLADGADPEADPAPSARA